MLASSEILSRRKSLATHVALHPLLAVILFGLFSFIFPWHQWTLWATRSGFAIAFAGGVVFTVRVRPAWLCDALTTTG